MDNKVAFALANVKVIYHQNFRNVKVIYHQIFLKTYKQYVHWIFARWKYGEAQFRRIQVNTLLERITINSNKTASTVDVFAADHVLLLIVNRFSIKNKAVWKLRFMQNWGCSKFIYTFQKKCNNQLVTLKDDKFLPLEQIEKENQNHVLVKSMVCQETHFLNSFWI